MTGYRKAERKKAKLRLGLSGPAGSGKTYSALLIAYGITGNWEEIGLIDTESHSGELYANSKQGQIGEYQYLCIEPPYSPEKYIEAIKLGERAGLKVIIIDSLTHAWAGEGGLLDRKGQIERKPGYNSWTAWRDVTPVHNRLVETILNTKCHVIATLRAKMEYVQEKDENGKTVVRKIGMGSIQRDGMDYEFTVFADIDQQHMCSVSKDRTGLLDGKYFKPDAETGRMLLEWLEAGKEPPREPERPAPIPEQKRAEPKQERIPESSPAAKPELNFLEKTSEPVQEQVEQTAEQAQEETPAAELEAPDIPENIPETLLEDPDVYKCLTLNSARTTSGQPATRIDVMKGETKFFLLALGDEGLCEVAKLHEGCFFKTLETYQDKGFTIVKKVEKIA
ncbi:hypothetical protein CEB3_c13790 [Peptococcaceae bacterium CEB3]|nr:hypothetical protein CEB3_c13790 [Peptococcaceae bacterium CEB3]